MRVVIADRRCERRWEKGEKGSDKQTNTKVALIKLAERKQEKERGKW